MTIELHQASLQLDHREVLSGVSVRVEAGEIRSVIGPNGAGKSSMLALLSGERQPSAGSCLLESKPLKSYGIEDLSQRLAILHQQSSLDFPFTVDEVIQMGRYPCDTSDSFDETIVSEVKTKLDLEHLSDRTYITLSGGEKQRVQLARVIAQLWDQLEQAVFLFDEPTAPLDLTHQRQFLQLCEEMKLAGACIVMVMHDINLASRYSDQITLLRDGHVLADAAPALAITESLIQQAYQIDVTIEDFGGRRVLVY
jgi:iron complex transport system ATP-binding protein